jgi:hypothetical protein
LSNSAEVWLPQGKAPPTQLTWERIKQGAGGYFTGLDIQADGLKLRTRMLGLAAIPMDRRPGRPHDGLRLDPDADPVSLRTGGDRFFDDDLSGGFGVRRANADGCVSLSSATRRSISAPIC